MGCISSLCRKILVAILSLIKVGVSIAIICIVAIQLFNVEYKISADDPLKINVDCLMTGSVKGGTVCQYTFAVCGVSLLLSLLTSFLLCITCDLCGLGDWLQFTVQGLQTAWWIIAAIVISKNVRDSNAVVIHGGHELPKEEWRDAVAVLSWVNAGIAFVIAVIYLFQACKCLKNCCSCCCGDDDEGKKANVV